MKIFIAVFLTLSFAFSVFAQKQLQVAVTSTFLRKEPSATAEKVGTVQKGERLNLERGRDAEGWYLVSTSHGAVRGWIRKDTVERAASAVADVQKDAQKETGKEAPKEAEKETKKEAQKPERTVPAAAAPMPSPTVKPIAETAENTAMTATAATTATEPISKMPPVIPAPAIVIAPPSKAPIATPTPSATPEEEQEVIRVESEEVNLNVRVVDANNRPVKNLDQAQFKIYEDGVLQTITSVSRTEAPMINALVIDNSRSLRTQLKSIIEAGKIIVGTNRAADETAVIRFVGADKIEVVRDFTANKSALADGLDNLFVEGGQTAIVDAVFTAAKKIEERQNSARRDDIRLRALILVSDGDDRASAHSEAELFDLLRKSQVQIYAVGFVNNLSNQPNAASGANRRGKAESFLTRLSEETGGRAFFPDSIEQLPQIAADISGELHAQYLVSYTPTNGARGFIKLKVEIEDGANKEKRIAVSRAGRIAAEK